MKFNRLRYFLAHCISKLLGEEYMLRYFRHRGISVGGGTRIYSDIVTSEPFLIRIGTNVTVSTNVLFVTHDNSIIKCDPALPNLYGYIEIGDNCFIGEGAILMYGIRLANNIIVAAGSVVCNSFTEERIIIGGNPAKKIGTWDNFLSKNRSNAMSRYNVRDMTASNPELFIKRKEKK